jgi:hypothetical protein
MNEGNWRPKIDCDDEMFSLDLPEMPVSYDLEAENTQQSIQIQGQMGDNLRYRDYQAKIDNSDDEMFPLSFSDSPEQTILDEPEPDDSQGSVQNHGNVAEVGGQSYCLPASRAGSSTRSHGVFPARTIEQLKTVMPTLYAEYTKETDTLVIKVVPFYPFDPKDNNTLGWEKFNKQSQAVTAINNALSTLHNNQSLYTHLAKQGATRIKTRVGKGETIGASFMQFLNSMISEYGVNTFKVNDEDCIISFREGTRSGASAPSRTNANTATGEGPWIAAPPKSGSLIMGMVELERTFAHISKGTQDVREPRKKCQNCVVGSVPIWTAGQRAELSAEQPLPQG